MRPRILLILCLALNGFACSEPQLGVKIPFVATWGEAPLSCEDDAAIALSDLRFYVSELSLIDTDGRHHALSLDEQLQWQQGDLALIDLENGNGSCTNGSGELYSYLVGFLPPGEYRGLEFTVGVPFERNHANPLTAEAPLDDAAMHWHWRSGYKFLRAGVATADDGFWVHLGSAGCEGTVRNVTGCRFPNRVSVTLPDFTIREHTVAIDLEKLLDGTDLADKKPSDCSSGPPEDACIAPFAALGLDFATGAKRGAQGVFSLRP